MGKKCKEKEMCLEQSFQIILIDTNLHYSYHNLFLENSIFMSTWSYRINVFSSPRGKLPEHYLIVSTLTIQTRISQTVIHRASVLEDVLPRAYNNQTHQESLAQSVFTSSWLPIPISWRHPPHQNTNPEIYSQETFAC